MRIRYKLIFIVFILALLFPVFEACFFYYCDRNFHWTTCEAFRSSDDPTPLYEDRKHLLERVKK